MVPIPFDKKRLGEIIREMRARKGWSQNVLSDEADISIPMISLLENGRRTPYADTIIKLADAFGVSTADILDQFLAAHDERDQDHDMEFIRKYQAASPEQKRNLQIIMGIVLSGDPDSLVP